VTEEGKYSLAEKPNRVRGVKPERKYMILAKLVPIMPKNHKILE